ncbi:MAG TPA: hypothetical protein VG944_11955 [Fimbriimonas sp.]|nr:hypothetical protein [Fimbriimonas sp.]
MLSAKATELLQPLLEVLPLNEALANLTPSAAWGGPVLARAEAIEDTLPNESLKAGLWLYVDDLDRSHRISQGIDTSLGSWWHGIMHRREGDFSNSKYWFRRAGTLPFHIEGYDPYSYVDAVAAARGTNPSDLVVLQRSEWCALFSFCADKDAGGS